ncbi:rhodanese-like domain-containing protein [Pseudahrensia aquimaris]|uniref:Rhodanese-like domain-containing protein n=1 Tax=Pseudahrensia aquimaris TaxID=744461 RepID=A0ABW3FFV3_9HYPH
MRKTSVLRKRESFNMAYAGDISPTQAWEMLVGEKARTVLVDVRTRPEWGFVGIPLLQQDMRAPVLEEWSFYPDMSLNTAFVPHVIQRLEDEGLGKDTNLLFLCRSGVRSAAAAHALTSEGYSNCYNIIGGFEGDPDGEGHRGTVSGWKVEGLPWRQ